jgi:3-methyladenine DNA glycosylase AlkD
LTPQKIASEILTALHQSANQRFADQAKTFFKGPVHFIGVRAADMHRIARETYSRVRTKWQADDAITLCELLLPDKRIEVKLVPLLLCERFDEGFNHSHFDKAQEWIAAGYCASWAIIDTVCPCVLGPLIARFPQLVSRTRRWTQSRNLWLRRAAAVALVRLARTGRMLDETYDIASRLLDDPEDLVQKATGWLLREAGKTDRERLRSFLQTHGQQCARTTLRYAIEHFPTHERQQILRQTRLAREPQPWKENRSRRKTRTSKRRRVS